MRVEFHGWYNNIDLHFTFDIKDNSISASPNQVSSHNEFLNRTCLEDKNSENLSRVNIPAFSGNISLKWLE